MSTWHASMFMVSQQPMCMLFRLFASCAVIYLVYSRTHEETENAVFVCIYAIIDSKQLSFGHSPKVLFLNEWGKKTSNHHGCIG